MIMVRYIENVCPGKFGVKQPPCYFLSCSHYKCRRRQKIELQPNLMNYGDFERSDYYEVRENDESKCIGVAIRNLTKEYGRGCCTSKTQKKLAVHDMSIDMFESEIFVLLGHNGAGKSTTMNI